MLLSLSNIIERRVKIVSLNIIVQHKKMRGFEAWKQADTDS